MMVDEIVIDDTEKVKSDNLAIDFPKERAYSTNTTLNKLEWKDVNFSIGVPNRKYTKGGTEPKMVDKIVLENVDGVAKPGEFLAIMGASGSGKTTLLNILSDRIRVPKTGNLKKNIYVNDEEFTSTDFGKIAAYVMQDDILLDTMTPTESLRFAANLRLRSSQEIRELRVQELIQELKLNKCKDTRVGNVLKRGLSGGERKRTAIGVEMITNPSLLFLDEPTSGLDSFTAYTIISLLTKLAARGKTVIAIIHQPSSDIYDLFDRLLLLVKGRTIYQSKTRDCLEYFKNIGYQMPSFQNPADYLMKIMHIEDPPNSEELQKRELFFNTYEEKMRNQVKNEANALVLPPIDKSLLEQKRATPCCRELSLLLGRSAKNLIRNPIMTKVRVGQIIILGIIMILLYWQRTDFTYTDVMDKNGAMFFCCLNQLMLALMSLVLTFPIERALFLREQANRMYGVFNYFISKTLVETPFQILMPILFSLIIYWAIGFRNDFESFAVFILILMLMVLIGNSIGFFIGALCPNERIAIAAMPAVILPSMLFAGFMNNVMSIPVWIRWIQYISPFRYSMEAMFRNQYREDDFTYDPTDPMNKYPVHSYNYDFGMDVCLAIMAVLAIVFRVLALVVLKVQVRKLGQILPYIYIYIFTYIINILYIYIYMNILLKIQTNINAKKKMYKFIPGLSWLCFSQYFCWQLLLLR